MASKELSILLLAKDMASKTIGKVNKEIGTLGKTGAIASKGLTTLGANLAKVGAVAAVGIGVAVKNGIASLSELESAMTSVAGAITQLGLAGQVTADQVAGWANEIEAATGAAFDDKAITAATATLIRFGKVTPKNLRPAMEVMTDLATKTGSVESAASLLAKALADPAKAAGKLARSGVILTESQQDQVEAMVEAGRAAEAQAFILDELAKSTKGAAAASQGPYQRAMSTLADVTEDAQRALAIGFLPVLEKLAAKLSKAMSDPKVIVGLESFGKTLAGGLDSALSIAEKLPWGTIGTSLQIAGAGAKTVLDAFTRMPPWVQTAILTGWGLNKLTGGALTGIVGELGKGLIKGVLGMNAGVVNINAGTVTGGTGGVVGGAAGKAGIGGRIMGAVSVIGSVAIAGASIAALAQTFGQVTADIGEEQRKFREKAAAGIPQLDQKGVIAAIQAIDDQLGAGPINDLILTVTGTKSELQKVRADLVDRLNVLTRVTDSRIGFLVGAANATTAAVRAIKVNPHVGFNLTVNTTSYVSVRDQRIATRVHNSYQGGSTAGGTAVAS